MEKTERLFIRISKDDRIALEAGAAKMGLTISSFLRFLINAWDGNLENGKIKSSKYV